MTNIIFFYILIYAYFHHLVTLFTSGMLLQEIKTRKTEGLPFLFFILNFYFDKRDQNNSIGPIECESQY